MSPAPVLTDQQVREMAAAIQAGADGVFVNCAKAVHDTAELYAAKIAPTPYRVIEVA